MKYTELRDWIKAAHTDLILNPAIFTNTQKAFLFNIDELKKKVKVLKKDTWYLVMDEPRGAFGGTLNENLLDTNRIGFFVLHFVALDKWADEDIIYDGSKIIGQKIFSKAYYERQQYAGLFRKFNPDTINYQKAGPELINWFGAYFSFEIPDNANVNLAYNPADWPEP